MMPASSPAPSKTDPQPQTTTDAHALLAIAGSVVGGLFRIVVVDPVSFETLCRIDLPDWNRMRFASAGHRLIEHGYMLHPAARTWPDWINGWKPEPGIGYLAPVVRTA
jgi:hypothetical protein